MSEPIIEEFKVLYLESTILWAMRKRFIIEVRRFLQSRYLVDRWTKVKKSFRKKINLATHWQLIVLYYKTIGNQERVQGILQVLFKWPQMLAPLRIKLIAWIQETCSLLTQFILKIWNLRWIKKTLKVFIALKWPVEQEMATLDLNSWITSTSRIKRIYNSTFNTSITR